jgi:hypothetical protein
VRDETEHEIFPVLPKIISARNDDAIRTRLVAPRNTVGDRPLAGAGQAAAGCVARYRPRLSPRSLDFGFVLQKITTQVLFCPVTLITYCIPRTDESVKVAVSPGVLGSNLILDPSSMVPVPPIKTAVARSRPIVAARDTDDTATRLQTPVSCYKAVHGTASVERGVILHLDPLLPLPDMPVRLLTSIRRNLSQRAFLGPNARVASLERYEKYNRKAEPQAAFLKVESRATRPDSCPLPATDHSVPHRGRRTIPRYAFLQISRLCGSVANLDAGSVPNAPIAIPNRGAAGPVTWRPYVDGSRRYVHRGWLIVAGAACYRRSKQRTNCQPTNNASGYLTTPSSRSLGCTREANTACD